MRIFFGGVGGVKIEFALPMSIRFLFGGRLGVFSNISFFYTTSAVCGPFKCWLDNVFLEKYIFR